MSALDLNVVSCPKRLLAGQDSLAPGSISTRVQRIFRLLSAFPILGCCDGLPSRALYQVRMTVNLSGNLC